MRPLRLPDGVPSSIHVFQRKVDLRTTVPDADWALLNQEERDRALRYGQHADRMRFVCARAGLRQVLGDVMGLRPGHVVFETSRHGKPQLQVACAMDDSLHFNVSHAGEYVLIALSTDRDVGVDIERRDPTLDIPELEPHILSDREWRADVTQRPRFFDCWTAKEAVLKAIGIGVAAHLRDLSVLLPDEAGGDHYRLVIEGMDSPGVSACRLWAPKGYAAALAWIGTD
ncbi:4'-phosphopantetheinyl transferase family protein [Pigmentiphaga litoralis]|uniref:4'-phosphopantetheinyl transferase n=1 Tax=Pigmentiphaga litoralis TaxID=516702 RepID=A0A7Y9LPX3_9BURK|nr:4'-phosphopantetheinyl transferase superfamily protein [Pigmentiphaga litoralis]NYE25975.1 4'-phosphopantetheinyl transferase [Pigmentiphaga litoralis]NYE85095.1 4'-phosphopantetheinyl transferase [Pigmentiphaga litoralis]